MSSKSKSKGYRHEARMSKILSEWSNSTWNRTPSSGALRWKGKTWTFCDLIPPEDLPVLMECKHHQDLSIESLLIQPNKVSYFWEELVRDKQRAEEHLGMRLFPMLVMKRDHTRDFLLLPSDILHSATRRFRLQGIVEEDISIMDLPSFLRDYKPDDIRNYLAASLLN